MNKLVCTFTAVAVLSAVVSVVSAVRQSSTATTTDTNEAAAIAEIFKQGLRTNQTNNPNLPDADMFGAALVSIAWERLGNNPDAATQMYAAFEQYVAGKSPREQYSLYDVFLENLEGALLKCRDADHLQANWTIRQKAIEKQTAALKEWADETSKWFDGHTQTISKLEKLADIKQIKIESDVQESVEFLLGDADAAKFDKTELKNKADNIAKLIDSKLANIVTKFKKDVETEEQRDLSGIVAPVLGKTATEDNDKVWKKGKYQELLEEVLPIVSIRENPAVTFWTAYRNDENDDTSSVDQLGKTYQEVMRSQQIRYNLWAVQVLSSDSDMTRISHIDTGFLEPSVSALYSQRESELMTKRPDERGKDVREILLRNKVPLSAF